MFVIVGKYGRLANRLWTYANVVAFAAERGIKVLNPAFRDFEDGFSFSKEALREKYTFNISGSFGVKQYLNIFFELLYRVNLRTHLFPIIELGEGGRLLLDNCETDEYFRKAFSPVFLSGFYFCAPESMERQAEVIRSFFTPNKSTMLHIRGLINDVREQSDIIVGIHMRQGDYKTFCDGIMYYSTQEYYDIMKYLEGQSDRRKIGFVVCSDEKQDMNMFKDINVTLSQGTAIEDLYTLSLCDYILGPNSSYSQWASWWGEVPLHILDWRTAEKSGTTDPVYYPQLDKHFSLFNPRKFYRYSAHEFNLNDFISR